MAAGRPQKAPGSKRATEFCVALANKPGTLAKLCGFLRRGGINVDAISVCENSECSWVRLVASPSTRAQTSLSRAGYHFQAQPVLTLAAHNRPGQLEGIASKLARAGVNIQYVYGSNAPGEKGGMVVLCVSDLAKAAKALR